MPPRIVALAMAALACAGSGLPPRGHIEIKTFGFEIRDYTLPSGMRIFLQEDHSAPVAGIVTLVGAGSTSDPPNKEGLAHFVEHLVFRAKPVEGNDSTTWDLLAQRGATKLNGETEFDTTVFYEYGPKSALPGLLRLAIARIADPIARVDGAAVEVERDIVRNELRERGESPELGGAFSWMQHALFPATSAYHHSVGGSEASLSTLTLADVQGFVKRHYRPDNVTIVIVGDVLTEDIRQILNKSLSPQLFGDGDHPIRRTTPRLSEPAPDPPTEPRPSAKIEKHEGAVSSPELWIGWSLPGGLRANSVMLDFVTLALNAYAYGAVWKDSDILDVSVTLREGATGSVLLCVATLAEGSHPETSVTHIEDQVAWLWLSPERTNREKLETANFFLDVQRMASLGLIMEAESMQSRAARIASFAHFVGEPSAYSRRINGMVGLERSKVMDFAEQYLSRDRARIVLVRPRLHESLRAAARMGGLTTPFDKPILGGLDEEFGPPAADIPSMQQLVKTVRLPNGLEVLIAKRGSIPVVTVELLLRGGSGDASPKGSLDVARHVADPQSHAHGHLYDFGARWGESVDVDHVAFHMRAASGNLPNLLAILSDRVRSMEVSEAALEHFRSDAAPVLKRFEARPERQAARAFWRSVLEPHPYSQLAAVSDLVKVSEQDVEAALRRAYTPKNAVVAIVGDVDLEAAAKSAQKWLGDWSPSGSGEIPAAPANAAVRAGKGTQLLVTAVPGAAQAEVSLGCALPAADFRASAIHRVAAAMVGDHLYDVVTRKLGASYGMRGTSTTLRGGTSFLLVDGNVENGRLQATFSMLKKYWDGLPAGDFDPRELQRARARDARELAFRFASSTALADFLLEERMLGRNIYDIEREVADEGSITKDDIQKALAECHERAVLSVVGDEGAVRDALRQAGWH